LRGEGKVRVCGFTYELLSNYQEAVSCTPCFKKTCNDLKCMNNLSVEEVYTVHE